MHCFLCKEAPNAVIELEHFEFHFQELKKGKYIKDHLEGLNHFEIAQRTCAAADRTGHAMLHTLYQQSLSNKAEFFIEYFAIDLVMDKKKKC